MERYVKYSWYVIIFIHHRIVISHFANVIFPLICNKLRYITNDTKTIVKGDDSMPKSKHNGSFFLTPFTPKRIVWFMFYELTIYLALCSFNSNVIIVLFFIFKRERKSNLLLHVSTTYNPKTNFIYF